MMSSDSSSRPAYKSALSEESSLAAVESDIYNLDVKAEVAKYRRRRRATILAIVAIFATAGAILIFSVVHDLQSRPEFEYEDYVCAESDKVCMENLCPRGHDWNSQLQVCQIKSGYDCCFINYGAGTQLYKCWASDETPEGRCVGPMKSAGVAPGTYKQLCRPGYLWVDWKRKCLRKD